MGEGAADARARAVPKLSDKQLESQQLRTWRLKWQKACALLEAEAVTFVDDEGTAVRMVPERLVSTRSHNYWVDAAFASWSVDALRKQCTDEGVLRLLEAQGWDRHVRGKRPRCEEDDCQEEMDEAEHLTQEEARLFAPVLGLLREQQSTIELLKAKLSEQERLTAAAVQTPPADEAAAATKACPMCVVMQACLDDLRHDKKQLLQQVEWQRQDIERLRQEVAEVKASNALLSVQMPA